MSAESREGWQEDEVNLLAYWQVLKKRSWMILGLTSALMFAVGFYSYFIMIKTYESTATILAPKEASGGGANQAALIAALRSTMRSSSPRTR